MRLLSRDDFITRLPLATKKQAAEALANVVAYRHPPSTVELRLVRIVWALPCERVERREDGGRDAYGIGVGVLVVDDLPAELGFTLALQVAATADDFERTHRFVAEVTSPSGDSAARFEGPLQVDSISSLAEPDEALTSISDGWLTFHAIEPGLYSVEVSVDGVTGAKFDVRVVVAEP